MRIGELAQRAGVSTRSLRYYEEQGLLVPTRTSGGQREYDPSDVGRVRFVQELYAAGLSSRKILAFLPLMDTGVATSRMRAHLDEEYEHIQEQIADLTRALSHVERLRHMAAQSAAGVPPEECLFTTIEADWRAAAAS